MLNYDWLGGWGPWGRFGYGPWGGLARERHAWDHGLTWRSQRTVDPDELPVDLAYIRNSVLRVTNGDIEDAHIENLCWQATEAAEDMTQRALMPQTWQMVLDRFPCHAIRLERPPLIDVTQIDYVDADGNPQTLTGSPSQFQVVPSGQMTKAEVVPLSGQNWPATKCQRDAVTVTYTAGYADEDSVPYLIRAGIALMVGELYKNRELSISSRHIESVLKIERFWKRVW